MEYKYWNTDEHLINVWFPKIYYEYSSHNLDEQSQKHAIDTHS
jgi:hypothetical protein